jgi:hypothetical protein
MPGKDAAAEKPDRKAVPDTEDDVEGHSMWIDPSMSRDLASSRAREIDRQIRDQQRAREARSKDNKHR